MRRILLAVILLAIAVSNVDSKVYTFLVILEGFRYDYICRGLSPNIDSIKSRGVTVPTLEPVYPTLNLPNLVSSITGLKPSNHGIIANRFMNPQNGNVFNPYDSLLDYKDWLSGETILKVAHLNGIKTASCYLPLIKDDEVDYFFRFNPNATSRERFDKALELLKLPYRIRPEIILLFISEADMAGHKYGTKSDEADKSIMYIDLLIGNLLDSIRQLGFEDSCNIIMYSTHGMIDFEGMNKINLYKFGNFDSTHIFNAGAFTLIYDFNHDNLFSRFDTDGFRTVQTECIYKPQLWIEANSGNVVITDSSFDAKDLKAIHGYDESNPEMHGIFCAMGPSFKKMLEYSTINIMDIFPLICRIYNFNYNRNIDGNVDKISKILELK